MDSATPDQYFVFHLGNERYAVLATSVREVMTKTGITRIPKTSKYLVGLCHIQNEFIPVINLMDEEDGVIRTKMAVFSSSGATWSILIDVADSVTNLDISTAASGDVNPLISSAVMGTATYERNIVRVFDANALFRKLEQTLSEYWIENTFAPTEEAIS